MPSSLELLKRKIQETTTPLDVVSSILLNFENRSTITTDYNKLHTAFFEIAGDELFSSFRFFKTGLYPFSPLLEDVLQRMAVSGMISCMNPIYENYKITEIQETKLRKRYEKFSGPQREQLAELGHRVETKLTSM